MDPSQLSFIFSDMRVAEREEAWSPQGAPDLPPPLLRYVDNDPPGVFSGCRIARGAILGELAGTPRDIYEIRHTEYMILTESCVLDLRSDPERSCEHERSVLTWIAEDNCTFADVNCRILRDVREDRFYMQAIAEIARGAQLVYSMQRYDEICETL
jgi:hypothetical protein